MNSGPENQTAVLQLLDEVRKGRSQPDIESERLIHSLVTGGTADGKTGDTFFFTPILCRVDQFSGNAFLAESRLDVKIIENTGIGTGEG